MLILLNINKSDQWDELLNSLPADERDPMMSAAWYRHFGEQGYGEAMCAAAVEGEKIALYPFLRNSINALGYSLEQKYYDIQGAPGYNGIATNSDDPVFLAMFREEFAAWCRENSIVAEFSRCNPVTRNHTRFADEDISEVNRNIIVNLQGDFSGDYDRSVRKNIRKAEREGLTVSVVAGDQATGTVLDDFTAIYLDTMDRNAASEEYRMGLSFFTGIVNRMKDQVRVYFTKLDQLPVAAEMVVSGKATAYSWMGGTLSDYYPLRPNDILKDYIIQDLAESGRQWYCLGGGLTPGDGIFRYKRTFAMHGERSFHIMKKVHLPGIYEDILNQWSSRNPGKTSGRLLRYRY
ncbi:MAG: GNAT family N-acetyltransferase [Bacteroidales bacterium]